MDPLSITVSVLALLQLTEKVISYAKQTRNAPKERTRILQEASGLVGLLITLKGLIDDCDPQDPWLRATSNLATPDGPLDQYKLTLESLIKNIMPNDGLRKVSQMVAWKFSKDEVVGLLSQIERVKSLINIALGMDDMALSYAIKEDLQVVQTRITDLKLDTSNLKSYTLEMKSDTTALRDGVAVQQKKDLMRWICPVDYDVQHQDFIGRHQTGTGRWFLQDEKFQEWIKSKDTTLFCPGIPGAGKTIVAALVIDHLLRTRHLAKEPLVFIYCNYKRQNEQSSKHILSSMLCQIIDIQSGVPKLVQDFYASHTTKKITPSFDEIRQTLQIVSKDLYGLTIVIDALDECEARNRYDLLAIIESMRECCHVRFMVTSRPFPTISLHPAFNQKPTLEIRASDEDLKKYVISRATELHHQVVFKADMLEHLILGIVTAAGGMFLLAQLLVDSFKDVMTVKELKSALKNLPKGSDAYDSAYHAAMDRIFAQGKGSREKAQKILAWILCAYRPLSTYELLHALAVEPGDTDFDEDNMMETEQLLAICAGLVTIDEQSDNVRFIHYTTQEYLQRNQQVWLPKANAEIARTCIAYLSIDDFAVGPCSSREDYDRRLKKFTLLNYATTYWGPHTNSLIGQGCIPGASEALIEAQALLLDTKCLSTASQALFMSNMWSYLGVDVEELGKGFSGCHWLGRFGLLLLLKEWTSRQYELDQSDFSGRTPLSWAAGNGHEAVVKLLMESDNVDVDSRDKSGRTPLSWAAENGEEVMVKLLLETGKVDVDSKDKYGQTPLARAAAKGQEAVVTLLVKTGKVDVDSKDEHGRTPLARATENGQEAVVKQLIRSDKVDVDSKNSYGQTPLSRAAWKGHEVIVKLLIETGKVVVDFKKWGGQTPLSLAAWYGREAVVKLLIGCDEVDVDSQDEQGRTPLSWAAVNGREAVVKLLIGTGKVDVDSKDKSGRTPLSWAAWNGREVIVELLIGTGEVNVDSKDDYGRTPLSRAAENGHEPMVKLFLKELVRSHLQSGRCESPVRNVTCNECHSMPKSEITRSTGLDTVDIYGRTPLMWAAMRGHISLIRTFWPSSLGPASSVITLKDTLGCSFIHLFAIGGCFEGICLLLDAGIDINTTDSQGWTPLYWAAYCNHENLVSLLLERQADRSLKNSRVWSAHRIALSIGADNILEIHKHSLVGGDDQTSRIAQRFDAYCDVCQQALLGIRYHCKSCYDFDLCFRCILDVSMIHPQHQFDSEEKFA